MIKVVARALYRKDKRTKQTVMFSLAIIITSESLHIDFDTLALIQQNTHHCEAQNDNPAPARGEFSDALVVRHVLEHQHRVN